MIGVVVDELELEQFQRIGYREHYSFACASLEASELWIKDLGLVHADDGLYSSFGKHYAMSWAVVFVGEECRYRLELRGMERPAKVPVGPGEVAVKDSIARHLNRHELLKQPGNVAAGGGYVQVRIPQVEDVDTGAFAPPSRSAHRHAPKDRSPEERAKLRDVWTKAKTAAECLWSSAKGDRSEMFGAAVTLNNCLERLWDLKAHRDENWVGILDQTQTALKALAATDGGIENVTSDQCWRLLQLVETYLSPATKTLDDQNKAVEVVSEMGLCPFDGLEPLGDA